MPNYPKPDYRFFFKSTDGMLVALTAFHWAPELAVWIHATFWGEELVIDPRSYRTALLVMYAVAGISFSIHLAGLLWSAWHHRGKAP